MLFNIRLKNLKFLVSNSNFFFFFFFIIFPECANTEQFRTAGSRIKIFGLDFYQLTEESNPERLGEKRERYLYVYKDDIFTSHWVEDYLYQSGVARNYKIIVYNCLSHQSLAKNNLSSRG